MMQLLRSVWCLETSAWKVAWVALLLSLAPLPRAAGWQEEEGESVGGRVGKTGAVEVDESIMNERPFDLITLTAEAGGDIVRVLPLDFPNRKVPTSPDPTEKLIVSMTIHPDRKYEVKWKDIAKIQLYEELVLQEAKRLMQIKDYASAFEHLNYLIENHPNTAGLAQLQESFLTGSAEDMVNRQDKAHGLAVLEELYRTYPASRTESTLQRISAVAELLIDGFQKSGDERSADILLKRLGRDYKDPPLEVVNKWDSHFRQQATELKQQAEQMKGEGKLREARVLASKMLATYPDLPGAKPFYQELVSAYPMIRVGVFQRSDKPDPTSIADWAGRRSGMLVSQPLFEFRNTGSEGGDYRFTLGTYSQSDDRKQLELKFREPGGKGPKMLEVSQWLLRRARPQSPDYRPSWAAIFDQISQEGEDRLLVQLRSPHVLPHALMQWQLPEMYGEGAPKKVGSYRIAPADGDANSFVWDEDKAPTAGQPVEIVERFYSDPRRAVSDLVRGEIEAIDQLYPADAKLLAGIKGIRVEPYALPTSHMLVPKSNHRFLQEADFRRALLYGINREAILSGEILGGETSADSRLISGPFPLGKSDSDPLSYAYNVSIEPVAYDPRLAKLLILLTTEKLKKLAAKKKEQEPKLEPIRLGVPDYEAARIAGEAFVQQWKILDIPATLVVLPKGQSSAGADQVDLLYVSAAMWEPATDAERLLGADGVAATNDPYIVQALGQLRFAKNWAEVRRVLQDLHSLIDDHLPVLPLWQITDTSAFRSEVSGTAKRPMSLYQDMEKWRIRIQ
jgi:hypothetical protein